MPPTNWELRYATHDSIFAARIHRRECGVAVLRRSTLVDATAVQGHMTKTKLKLIRRPNGELRTREYLTGAEVEKLIAAAKRNRWGQRDSTMICFASAMV